MNDSNNGISSFLKRINLLHKAIMASPVLVGIVLYQLADNPYLLILHAWDILLAFVISTIVLGIYLSDLIFRKYLLGISIDLSLPKKLEKFQTAFLLKMILLEMPALISTAVFYLTQNQLYLMIIGGMVVYMSLQSPKKESIIRALDLRGKEKVKFN
ncbi:MAG: hypothetical protein RIB79_10855 [Allomuricauda sp.]|jgi:hypothetical protein